MSKSITQYCFCHSALRLNNKNHWAPNRIVGLSLVKGKPSTLPGGAPPRKNLALLQLLNEALSSSLFSHPREIFLDSNLRCFCRKLASPHLRHISFFDCSEGSSANRSRIFYAAKKLFRKLRLRCFGKLRFLKACPSVSLMIYVII